MDEMTISGAECVAALCLAGFQVTNRDAGGVTLRGRRGQIVVVPETIVLPHAMLDGLLEEAAISHERFLALLSEAPTQPDLATLDERDSAPGV